MESPGTAPIGANDVLKTIEDEIYRNEKMIKLSVAIDYMIQLVDPKLRPLFEEAGSDANSLEEMTRILELAKKIIGQKAAISMLRL